MNDNVPEDEDASYDTSYANRMTLGKTDPHSPDLWLPVPSRAQHDELISTEAWERRERARREAEAVISKAFALKP